MHYQAVQLWQDGYRKHPQRPWTSCTAIAGFMWNRELTEFSPSFWRRGCGGIDIEGCLTAHGDFGESDRPAHREPASRVSRESNSQSTIALGTMLATQDIDTDVSRWPGMKPRCR